MIENVYSVRHMLNKLFQMFKYKGEKMQLNTKLISDIFVTEEQTMNCPFSVIMVPVLCPSQVQYYDNWRLAVPSQYTPPHTQVMLMTDDSLLPLYVFMKFSLN